MAKRPSSIDRMPAEVRDWIGRLREQGRTLDEIIAKLRELDLDAVPSRSALGRHLKQAEFVTEALRRSRTIADVVVRNLGDAPPDKMTRLNIELMHQTLFNIISPVDGEPIIIDPMQAMLLTKALDHLGKAKKDDLTYTAMIEKRAAEKARAEALKQAEAAVVKVGGPKALTPELKQAFKAMLFGQSDG